MPELPEVEAITESAARFCIHQQITKVEVLRQNGKYFGDGKLPIGCTVMDVYRLGKWIMFRLDSGQYIQCHNAMSGFWDYEHAPWTFDYVEGVRESNESHVRVKITLSDGSVIRFHDTRLFGSLRLVDEPPKGVGWEILKTTYGDITRPTILYKHFREYLYYSHEPIKHVLMDQTFLAGIGNIYSNEALHASCIDPLTPSNRIEDEPAFLLLESLKCVLRTCIPEINYGWLKVYRRRHCGSCGFLVHRELIKGRATFSCPRCQWLP